MKDVVTSETFNTLCQACGHLEASHQEVDSSEDPDGRVGLVICFECQRECSMEDVRT